MLPTPPRVTFATLFLALWAGLAGCSRTEDAPGVAASATALIPRVVLFGNPERIDPSISPDGKQLAYIAPSGGVLNLWVRSVAGGDDRAVTDDRGQGIWEYAWAPDSRSLVYLQDRAGDENSLLYSVDPASGASRCLTPFDGVQAQLLAMDPRYPDHILVALNRRDPLVHDVYRLRIDTGALELAAEPPGNVRQWFPDRGLRIRGAQVSRPDGGYDFLVRDGEQGAWRTVAAWDLEDAMTSRPLAFTEDGTAAYLIDSRGANTGRLVRLDLASGAVTVLAEDPENDLGDEFGAEVLFHPATGEPQAVGYFGARREWIVLDPALEPVFARLRAVDDGDWTLGSRSADDATWILHVDHDRRSPRYYVVDRATGTATLLFASMPDLDAYALAPMEPVTFPARDGLVLHGYMAFPPGMERRNLPLIVNPHGGPWFRDWWGYNPEVQWLANRGYAVLQVNFRGSTGYGKAHINAADKEWGRKMLWDLVDGARWAVGQGWADSTRLGVYGGSFGGYQTLCAATFTPDVFRCAIDVVGPSNLLTFLRSLPPQWESRKARFYRRGGDPDTEEAMLRERSPYFHAERIHIPMLIAQGANDPRVKQVESDQIVAKLRENGVEHEYLVFPDEGHGFARPENRERFYETAERFLARHLGGRVEAPPDSAGRDGNGDS